jgi:hypothetical protein
MLEDEGGSLEIIDWLESELVVEEIDRVDTEEEIEPLREWERL